MGLKWRQAAFLQVPQNAWPLLVFFFMSSRGTPHLPLTARRGLLALRKKTLLQTPHVPRFEENSIASSISILPSSRKPSPIQEPQLSTPNHYPRFSSPELTRNMRSQVSQPLSEAEKENFLRNTVISVPPTKPSPQASLSPKSAAAVPPINTSFHSAGAPSLSTPVAKPAAKSCNVRDIPVLTRTGRPIWR